MLSLVQYSSVVQQLPSVCTKSRISSAAGRESGKEKITNRVFSVALQQSVLINERKPS